jgi:predicted aminopeptidase
MRALYPYRVCANCMKMNVWLRCLAVLSSLLVVMQLGGCSAGYYWQAAMGQMRLSSGKQSVASLFTDNALSADEVERLEVSQQALDFGHEVLLLPDNGGYRSYYDTGQPYVVWNVFAAPEFSLSPRNWCFPITGCIAYKGYFSEESAREYAAKLAAKGADVHVGGVTAYSTLGRLHDPILNTMLTLPEASFVGLLFHELSHQLLYIKNDSAFNEGFATAVEQEGVSRWQASRAEPAYLNRQYTNMQRKQALDLQRYARAELETLYETSLPDADKRGAKVALLAGLKTSYQQLAREWDAAGLQGRPYGGLVAMELNNAVLSAMATYDDYVPAFELVLSQCDGDLECFYDRARQLSELPAEERGLQIEQLLLISSQQQKSPDDFFVRAFLRSNPPALD